MTIEKLPTTVYVWATPTKLHYEVDREGKSPFGGCFFMVDHGYKAKPMSGVRFMAPAIGGGFEEVPPTEVPDRSKTMDEVAGELIDTVSGYDVKDPIFEYGVRPERFGTDDKIDAEGAILAKAILWDSIAFKDRYKDTLMAAIERVGRDSELEIWCRRDD